MRVPYRDLNIFKVRALVSEGSALSTVLHCLALHSTSRGITDSAVAVAGALLAAAHEGGWESISATKNYMVHTSFGLRA